MKRKVRFGLDVVKHDLAGEKLAPDGIPFALWEVARSVPQRSNIRRRRAHAAHLLLLTTPACPHDNTAHQSLQFSRQNRNATYFRAALCSCPSLASSKMLASKVQINKRSLAAAKAYAAEDMYVMSIDQCDSLDRRNVVCGGGAAVFSTIVATLIGNAKPNMHGGSGRRAWLNRSSKQPANNGNRRALRCRAWPPPLLLPRPVARVMAR
jgi:hypothetical protein